MAYAIFPGLFPVTLSKIRTNCEQLSNWMEEVTTHAALFGKHKDGYQHSCEVMFPGVWLKPSRSESP